MGGVGRFSEEGIGYGKAKQGGRIKRAWRRNTVETGSHSRAKKKRGAAETTYRTGYGSSRGPCRRARGTTSKCGRKATACASSLWPQGTPRRKQNVRRSKLRVADCRKKWNNFGSFSASLGRGKRKQGNS